MNRIKPLSVLMAAALLLSGCASVYTADELAKLQAPDPLSSRARSLMAVFDFDVPDRAPDGSAVVLEEKTDGPNGGDNTQATWGMPNVRAVVEASLQSADPLMTPHFFGFVTPQEAADEKTVVRRMAAQAVMQTASLMAGEGWRFAWTKPFAREMSLSYVVTQDIFFEKEGTACRLPENIDALQPWAGEGCRVTVVARSRDVSKGRWAGEGGLERVPAWIDPAQPEAWRMRSVLLLSTDGKGGAFLTPERQRSLAARSQGLTFFYGLDEKGLPFVGENGRIERFTASAESIEAVNRARAEAAEPVGSRLMRSVTNLWPFGG